jgi:hypothetical protein
VAEKTEDTAENVVEHTAEDVPADVAEDISEDIPEDESTVEEPDFVTRIQRNVENSRIAGTQVLNEEFTSRMRMLTPDVEDADDDDEDEDEIIEDKLGQTVMDLFFTEKPEEALTEEAPAEAVEEPAEETVEEAVEQPVEESVEEAVEETVEAPVEEAMEEPVAEPTEYEDEIVTDDIPVPDTVMDIFATAVDILDVKKQLAETFTKLESSLLEKEDILAPYDINFVVSGTDESMKSQISIGIAKALNTYGMCDKTKIVRATSEELNRMDFSMVFEKIAGGCLIIGNAGTLSEKSVSIISDYVHREGQKTAIVLEASETNLQKLWKKYPKLRARFLNVINIAKYDESELVKLAESYAKRRGYDISEEVRMVTLREIFEKRMLSGEDVNYEDVMAVVDEAVVNLEKRNMKNLFMTVLDNAYKEASMFTLLPEDFD